MTNDITASAAAAREAARTSTGQFGTQPLDEADIELMPLSERLTNPIDVQFGDLYSGYPEIVDATVMDSVTINRDYDEHLTATGSQVFRYSDWAPEDLRDEYEREQWGERHQAIIDAVIEERYADSIVNSDGDEAQVRFEYDLGTGPVTKQDVIDKMSTGPAVAFYNESDDGTFGTENLSRIIQEKIDRSVVVDDVDEALLLAGNLRTSGLHWDGPFGGNVTDQLAMASAAEAAHLGDYPELRRFSRYGHGEHALMVEELDDLDAADVLEEGPVRSLRVYLDKKDPAQRERQG